MLRFLTRTGLRRGLLGGSRPWTTIFVVAGALRLVARATKGTPKIVYTGELEPGQTLVIAHPADGTKLETKSVKMGE